MQEHELDYPVRFDATYPESSNRVLGALGILWIVKPLLLLPHLLCLWFLGVAMALVAWIGFWAILVTGQYPRTMFEFVLGVLRWQNRANAWVLGITDRYPPFSLR